MKITNQKLAEIISGIYYCNYDGENDIDCFIEWLENDDGIYIETGN